MLEELERVRAYRGDVSVPDEATFAAARAELMEAMSQERRHASTGPEPRGARSRQRLRKLQRRRRLVLAGALATVGVGIAGVLGLTTAATPVSALAAQMNQLAKVAASQRWTGIPGPGQYIYTESEGPTETDTMGNDKECVVAQVDHRQIWIATDGSGAIDETRSGSHFTSTADAQTCALFKITDASSQNNTFSNRFPAGGLSLPTNDWTSLSTDPATLLKQVHQRDGGPNTPREWLTNVADFMRESDAPPAIRAALYQATALIPGVKLLGPVTAHDGQTGLGVAFYAAGQPVHALIFDQSTGRLIEELYYDKNGDVTDWTDYMKQAIVDKLPNYPLEPANPAGSSGTTTAAGTTTAPAPPATTTATGTATAPAPPATATAAGTATAPAPPATATAAGTTTSAGG